MRVRRDSCQSGERVGVVWCERVRYESLESEERKLCEWSETVGTECFESGEGERERVALESW